MLEKENFDKLVGYTVESIIKCTRVEGGMWKVNQTLKQGRTENGNDWEIKKVELSTFDKDIAKAIASSYFTIVAYIDSIGGDLFKSDDDNISIDALLTSDSKEDKGHI